MPRLPRNDEAGFLFIADHLTKTGKPPTFQAVANHLGYASKRSVQLMVGRLTSAGRITKANGEIGLPSSALDSERTVSVPVVGTVSCGPAMFADENVEMRVSLTTSLAKPGHVYFIVRAKGESMNKSGIHDGDLVLVRKQGNANRGDKVVALVDDEATIKVFDRKNGFVMLMPNSTDLRIEPIILSRDFLIQGVVVTTIPNPLSG